MSISDKIQELIKSRRFWVVAATIAVVVLKDKTGLDEDQITNIVLAIGSWVVGESLRSTNNAFLANKSNINAST